MTKAAGALPAGGTAVAAKQTGITRRASGTDWYDKGRLTGRSLIMGGFTITVIQRNTRMFCD
ncbi:hypothetical protein KCP77_12890 [Salmonella enterica subsp. enterica]|nr:hypothetical protein KCP77_12890 [Salmonella enterica subsp. enterica]